MALANTEESWGWPARVLHWVMAALILFMIVGGLMMVRENDLVMRIEQFQFHKSVGFTIFVLALLRVGWRISQPLPNLPSKMPSWQRHLSRVSHWTLYLLILTVPITGWLYASATPLNDVDAYPMQFRNMVFGLFDMPDPFPTGDAALSQMFRTAHNLLGKLLMIAVVFHILASLKHHFVDRDHVLKRMIGG